MTSHPLNRKLKKCLKTCDNTEILEIDSNIDLFTKHGLHLNPKGKDLIPEKIAQTIKVRLNRKMKEPIILKDSEVLRAPNNDTERMVKTIQTGVKDVQLTHEVQTGSIPDQEGNKLPPKRIRKPPNTRHNDFLLVRQENKPNVKTNNIRMQKKRPYELVILHHNVQSLYSKLLDLSISISTDDINADVLCFTEHWLKMNQLDTIVIDQFKLVSSFSRSTRIGGGSSIFVKDFIRTKEVVYINRLGCESTFEVSATELTDFNLIIVCIYISPDGNFAEFLSVLEAVICKEQSKGINLFLCGDWNVSFLQNSPNLLDLKKLLLMYNLEKMVDSPTRITHSSATQIDVMITNTNCAEQTTNYDLGYSDHFAQVTHVIVNKPVIDPKIIKKRRFSDIEIKEFLYHLQTESWDQILLQDDVNESFNAFMTIKLN